MCPPKRLGAHKSNCCKQLTPPSKGCLYIPNKDQHDQEIGTQRRWVLDAIRLLSEINGGATAIQVEGGWVNEDGTIILEHPVIVYSFITRPDEFVKHLPRIRAFLHQLGRETNQGEVAFEFDDC